LFITLFGGCKDNYVSSVPAMLVSLKIDFSGKYNTFKNSSNEFLTFETPIYDADRLGFAGILVYSSPQVDEYGNTIYYAFDMACTHEISRTAKVYPIKGSLGKVKCNKCGSVFDISFGVGHPDNTSGPAKEVLRRYKVTITENYLYVYR